MVHLGRKAKRRVIVIAVVGLVPALGWLGVRQVRAVQQGRLVEAAREKGLAAHARQDWSTTLEHLKYFVQHRKNDPAAVEAILAFAEARRNLPLENGRHIVESRDLLQHARSLLRAQSGPAGRTQPGLRSAEHDALEIETRRRLLALYAQLDQRPEAIECARWILDREPRDAGTLEILAQVLYRDRAHDAALETLERLSVVKPAEVGWRHMTLSILREMGRPEEELISRLETWVAESAPNESGEEDSATSINADRAAQASRLDLLILQARWLDELGRPEDARSVASSAARLGADSPDVLRQLLELLDSLDLGDDASAVLARAAERFPREQWVREAEVRRLWHAGRVQAALVEVRRAEEDFGEIDPALMRLETLLWLAASRSDRAGAVLDRLERETARASAADATWCKAVRAHLAQPAASAGAAWRTTVDRMRDAIAIDPSDATLHFLLGDAWRRAGESSLAAQEFSIAWSREPQWLGAGAALAEALLRAERPQEAFEVSRLVAARAPEARVPLYVLLSRAWLAARETGGEPELRDGRSGRTIDVAELLRSLWEQVPAQREEVAPLLVEALAVSGRGREAQTFVEEVLDDTAASPAELVSVAEACARLSLADADALLALARNRLAPEERSGLALSIALLQADLLAARGHVGEGLAHLDEAIVNAAPADAGGAGGTLAFRRLRAEWLLRHGHPEGAAALRAILDDPSADVDELRFALSRKEAWGDRATIERAIERLSSALGADSQQVALAEARALLLFEGTEDEQRARAIVAISALLDSAPDSLPALLLMVEASLGSAPPSVERAIEYLERAVRVAPGRRDLLGALVALHQGEGDFEAAGRWLEEMSRLPASDRASTRQEVALLEAQGAFASALARSRGLDGSRAGEADRLMLARLHRRAGELDAAWAVYESILESEPSGLARAEAADFLADRGEYERAVEIIDGALSGEGDRAIERAAFAMRHGRLDEARTSLDEALRVEPRSVRAFEQYAVLHLLEGDASEALSAAARGLAIEPGHAGLARAKMIARLGESSRDGSGGAGARAAALAALADTAGGDEALAALVAVLTSVPADAPPSEKDLAAVSSLVERYPRFLSGWLAAVALHHEARRSREAVDLARRAVARFPSRPEAAEWATRVLIDGGRWEEALVEAREWRRRVIDSYGDADAALASILLHLDRPADAARQLAPDQRAIDRLRDGRENAPGRFALWLQAAALAGETELAWRTVRPVALAEPAWAAVWVDLSRAAEYDAAAIMLVRLEEALRRDGDELRLDLARGWIDLALRYDRPTCLRHAGDLIASAPRESTLRADWFALQARVAEGRVDRIEAERLYREALRVDQGHVVARNNLACLLAETPEGLDEALVLVGEALTARADHPDLLDTKATILLRLGRQEEARRCAERAIELRSSDPGLRLTLAEVLAGSEVEAAKAELRAARRVLDRQIGSDPSLERRMDELEARL